MGFEPEALRTIGSDFFSKPIFYCFLGYPGSGVAHAMASISVKYVSLGNTHPLFLCCDDWTVGKSEQIRKFADIIGNAYSEKSFMELSTFETKRSFVYLRGYTDTALYSVYEPLFAQENIRTILVIDCSRDHSLNMQLIRGFKPGYINAVILTRIDMQPDLNFILDDLGKSYIPLLFATAGEELANDSPYLWENSISEIHYSLLRKWR